MVRRGIFELGSAYARHPALKPDDLQPLIDREQAGLVGVRIVEALTAQRLLSQFVV